MHILDMSFISYVFCKYFLPLCGLSSHALDSAFHKADIFNLMKSNLSIFSFMEGTFGIIAPLLFVPSLSFILIDPDLFSLDYTSSSFSVSFCSAKELCWLVLSVHRALTIPTLSILLQPPQFDFPKHTSCGF